MAPRVSVLMPTYSQAHFIRRALDSLLAQTPRDWELRIVDDGWLHSFVSENRGELRRATWDDLNLPARIGPMAAAGLPLFQYDNRDAVVATHTLARERDLGLFYREIADLRRQLDDRARLEGIRQAVWRQRQEFSFDHHAGRLVAFLRQVIERKTGAGA